jgi:nitroreductase
MLEVLQQRKSVRHFTGAPVSRGDLETIVRAGMAAPTARNMQPWSFVVVTERQVLDRLAKVLPYAQMLEKAGAAIVVCTEAERAVGRSKDFAIIDACLAGENILLAIEALGLGGVWTAVYPDPTLMVNARGVLGIPAGVIPLNVIPVGVPTGEDQPKDKYNEEKVHWERW